MQKRKSTLQREEVNARYRKSLELWKKDYPIDEKSLPSPKIYEENVRKFREKAKMSQGVVGKMLGVSTEVISCIEKGARKTIDIDMAYQLSSILSCTIYDLLKDQKDLTPSLTEGGKALKPAVLPASVQKGDFFRAQSLVLNQCPELFEQFCKIANTQNLNVYALAAQALKAINDYLGLNES